MTQPSTDTEALLELAEVLAGRHSITRRLEELCRLATVMVGCDRASVYVLEDGRFRPWAQHGVPEDLLPLLENTSFSPRHPLVRRAVDSDEAVIIDDLGESGLLGPWVARTGVHALILAALVSHDHDAPRAVGFISVDYAGPDERPDDSAARHVLAIARVAGPVVQTELMRRTERAHRRQARARVQLVEGLLRVGADAVDNSGRPSVLTRVVELLANGGFASGARIVTDDEVGRVVAAAGVPVGDAVNEVADTAARIVRVPVEGDVLAIEALVLGDPEVASSGVALVAGHLSALLGRMDAADRMRQMALTDDVTNLPNRHHLVAFLAEHLPTSAMTVLALDLDSFKIINDSLGHDAGDSALREIADRLLNATTPHFVARFGGDEFVVVVRDEDPDQVVARVRTVLERPLSKASGGGSASASIGLASAARGADPADVLRDADAAMYVAKSGGAGRVQRFDRATRTEAIRRQELATQLRVGLHAGQLELFHQPSWSLPDRRLGGFEALLRWRRTGGTVWLPSQFLDVADQSLLMHTINDWVIDEACRQAARRLEVDATLDFAINLSPRWLDRGVVATVEAALETHGLPPERLVVEVTEDGVLTPGTPAWNALLALADRGVQLSLDDFGTGYSSFLRLAELPLAEIKIDREVVHRLTDGPAGRELIRAITRVGAWRAARVVAEGARDDSHLAALAELGCTHAQCFHLGVPLNAQEALELVRAHAPAAREDH
ncbi:putative bifunctional diguanylate cyclase/phosphodiesterase [Euzebya rosea]|uniref:putative bifunctional diguanylate cyclase/phosphodiesterase n=1 Tax=Euzebya rosea TaxID=2052804 RepID=UPI000D3E56F5|nr:EAL domain-containing protein [Euzebya rosea]